MLVSHIIMHAISFGKCWTGLWRECSEDTGGVYGVPGSPQWTR